MPLKSNVYIKSNVYPRKNGDVWQDGEFLSRINDGQLLYKYHEAFKRNRSSQNIKNYFTEDQLDLATKFNGRCLYAQGIRTYGFTTDENGRRVLVCRCPHAKEGGASFGSPCYDCHKLYKPIVETPLPIDLDKKSNTPFKKNVPDAPAVPAAIKAETPTAIVPEINKTITPELPKPKPEPEKIIDVTEDKAPAQNTESFDIVYPDQLVLSCNGYDIRGEKVGDGEYEIRITSGGVFIANINSYGIVVGKHSRLKTEELNAANGSVSVAFDNFEKMNIHLQQDPAPIANIAFGYTKLSVCVK